MTSQGERFERGEEVSGFELDSVRELRTKAYRYRSCDEPEEHDFVRIFVGDLAILALCTKCGRTPLEMLAELRIQPQEGHPSA